MKKIALTIMSATAIAASAQAPLTYPEAPKSATVDTYFGIEVADPYRPLENDTAAETAAWVEAERALTENYLNRIPFRSAVRSRIAAAQNYTKRGLPWRGNDGRIYLFENSGLKNQSVLFRADKLGGTTEVFLDPNALSDDGTVALTGISMSENGDYVAYTVSRSGSDWTEIYVIDNRIGKLMDDHIEWAKFTSAVWYKDGFFYSAYDRPEAGKEFSNANEGHRIYYHKLGTPQSADTVFYEDKGNPLYFHTAYIPRHSDYIFVMASGQGFGNSIKYRNLSEPDSQFKVLEPTQDYEIGLLGVRDSCIYFTTNYQAPRYRLMRANLASPDKSDWTEVIPESDAVLSGVAITGDKLVAVYDRDASSRLFVFDINGNMENEIELPGIGTVGFSSEFDFPELFYSFTSFTEPGAQYAYDFETRESRLVYKTEVPGLNSDDYVTEEVFYPSSDGQMVHLFLTRKKDLQKNGKNPVYLYGYGGFNISLPPSFSPNRLVWLENGGIYAQANLRGGAEYGEEWHLAGTKQNKLNVFNDFISAAEYLIREGWTSPEYLAIEGASNGGLLVGATVNMRPDLFRVAIPRVGVMDMMRYHLFTIGWNWAPDYGTSADSPEMASYLLGYSPLYNISNDGTPYPAIMVTTADHDDRVVPAHSFKYAAMLQASDTGSEPKIIRIDSKAGHGAGKPIAKVIDEYADIYSFIFYNMGLTPGQAE